ncbi:MAG: hypothetical protein ABSF24_00915 [Candidatus Bathyarchaeia archaeon]
MKCPICNREVGEQGYCKLHAEVYEVVIKKYDRWKKATEISWKEYLREIAKNPLTGEWARIVAQYLTEVEDRKNVKNS